ncbi:glycerophosphoryl diester phosphodiesterase [Allocatelliglobosispora scoriae]|uniref:Glycerophosphoryl diester phosphodiesterase n=1 Tax=Allocatelliglobosispora scoriae TaxID=643052 RepID=A0A841C2P2_9ACTN|nr:glycerophosphodiester phosphodiesterase family protein [Allocatelliglobosispora scoriae]MBB5873393.1 glycerophosphoryl diester phosphodiesterase [Allocatelliglobosispora scoriae]
MGPARGLLAWFAFGAVALGAIAVSGGVPALLPHRAVLVSAATAGVSRPPGTPLTVVAHRGASADAPENTLPAQRSARAAGAVWIENDVQPSADGVPFVLHDSTVDRTTDGTGSIRRLTSAQLKSLDAGAWFGSAFTGTRVPTLAEQLADLREHGGNLLLEIKGPHTRDEVATIIGVVRAERMSRRVLIQSFDPVALQHSYDLAPDLPLGLLRDELDADPVAVSARLHLAAYNPAGAALMARPSAIADLHRAGVAVLAWTVDSADGWRRLDAAGVDGVITNRPAALIEWIASASPSRPPR